MSEREHSREAHLQHVAAQARERNELQSGEAVIEEEVRPEDIERVRGLIAGMRETSRRFDEALGEYGALLRQQERAGIDLERYTELVQVKRAQMAATEKRAKLAAAVAKYAASSSIFSVAAGFGTMAFTGDPVMAATAGAGGAMTGAVVETALSHAEHMRDRSEAYLKMHPAVKAAIDRQKEWEASETGEVSLGRMEEEYALLQGQIDALAEEIDTLAVTGFTGLSRKEEASVSTEQVLTPDAKERFLELIQQMKNAGQNLDELLLQYRSLTEVIADIQQDIAEGQQAHDQREFVISLQILAKKAWRLLRHVHISSALGIGGGTGAYIFSQTHFGLDPTSATYAAVSAGAAGVSIGFHYFSRLEKNVFFNNLPYNANIEGGRLSDQRNNLMMEHTRYRRGSDPVLAKQRRELQQIRKLQDELTKDQAALDERMDAFVRKFMI